MCLILDTDIAHHFNSPMQPDASKVLDWVEKRGGCIVYGGKNADELFNAGPEIKRLLLNLSRAGRAKQVLKSRVELETDAVLATGLCRSNDPHIIALARTSNARVLFSHDANLHIDFKNAQLLAKPRGVVYQNENQTHLLRHTNSCIGRPGE